MIDTVCVLVLTLQRVFIIHRLFSCEAVFCVCVCVCVYSVQTYSCPHPTPPTYCMLFVLELNVRTCCMTHLVIVLSCV